MRENIYQLAGCVTIPEEKRDEFNRKVMTILDKGGIRKTQEVQIAGRTVPVVVPAKPDVRGSVSFDYSIFEKKIHDMGEFDMYTGELKFSDDYHNEYGLIMNLIMVLQEAYSETPCFLTYEGKPEPIDGPVELLNSMLGEKMELRNGISLWEMLRFFHESKDHEDVEPMDALRACYRGWTNMEQVLLVLHLDDREVKLTEEVSHMDRHQIRQGTYWNKRERLYRLLVKHCEDVGLEEWLKMLLSEELEGRKKMGEALDDYGEMAELSTYFLSQEVASLYAISRGEAFWSIWDRMGIEGYRKYISDDKDRRSDNERVLPFYKVILRENENEFLEWWDGENLELSEKMTEQLEKWKEQFVKMEIPLQFDTESLLGDVLDEMNNIWECRLVDGSFVDEFLAHKSNPYHQKLLLVLWNYLNEGVEDFPELTRKQAVSWLLRRARDSGDKLFMAGYATLMTNHDQRKCIFGA